MAVTGNIQSPDGSTWRYEIGTAADARLLWVLRAPDETWRSAVAAPTATVSEVVEELRKLVVRKSSN